MRRRTFLKGLGASISLPLMESMLPAGAARAARSPLRVGYVYSPNGIVRDRWRPAVAGRDFELTDVLRAWAPFRDQLLLLSDLDNGDNERVSGHVGAGTTFLTGREPVPSQTRVRAGMSVDQALARVLGRDTAIGSLQVCAEDAVATAGPWSPARSNPYTDTISWRDPATPLRMEHRPRAIFERLVGGTDPALRGASVLDAVQADYARVRKWLGAADRPRLDGFLAELRAVERRLAAAERLSEHEARPGATSGRIAGHDERLELLFDLLLLAFRSDSTRVFTFMFAREESEIVYAQLGHSDGYHSLTHHRGIPARKQLAGDIDVYHGRHFARFVTAMKNTQEFDGSSLLDNSILVYGAGLGNADIHSQWNVPVALVGGGAGVRGGRHVVCREGTPLGNLHATILDGAGLPGDAFGRRLDLDSGALA